VFTDNGPKRVREATEIRNDVGHKRLKLLSGVSFVYNVTYEFYKSYTLKKNPLKILPLRNKILRFWRNALMVNQLSIK